MKAKTLSLLATAGFGGSMLLGQAAPAAYTGIMTEQKENAFGVFVVNVYALFDNTNDIMTAVGGTPQVPLTIEVIGGTFYQHALGGDLAPNPDLILAFPSLAYDSFVTIGKKTSVGDHTGLAAWTGFGPSQLPANPDFATNTVWFITPDSPTGAPIDGRVLIGQFGSNDLTEGTGNSIRGTFLISAVSDGDPGFQTMASFFHGVPAPGALALLGLAGMVGRRRSR